MLKNAGLIRLIENDSLVVELQTKYSIHSMYKNNEADITRINNEIERCYCELPDLSVIHKNNGHFNYGKYISNQPVPPECLNWVWAKKKRYSVTSPWSVTASNATEVSCKPSISSCPLK